MVIGNRVGAKVPRGCRSGLLWRLDRNRRRGWAARRRRNPPSRIAPSSSARSCWKSSVAEGSRRIGRWAGKWLDLGRKEIGKGGYWPRSYPVTRLPRSWAQVGICGHTSVWLPWTTFHGRNPLSGTNNRRRTRADLPFLIRRSSLLQCIDDTFMRFVAFTDFREQRVQQLFHRANDTATRRRLTGMRPNEGSNVYRFMRAYPASASFPT